MPSTESSIDMLDRIRTGDEEAFGALVEEVWAPLVLHLEPILGSQDEAQDLTQEALIRVWEKRDQWAPGPARGLVFRIGRNLAFDQLDRRKVRARWAQSPLAEPATPPTPEEETIRSEVESSLREAMNTLPQRRREVIEMIRFRGLSYAEIGEALGISVRTVANHATLGFRDLRLLLASHLDSPSPPDSIGNSGRVNRSPLRDRNQCR